jgi:uncharacterized protein (DUF885 family)
MNIIKIIPTIALLFSLTIGAMPSSAADNISKSKTDTPAVPAWVTRSNQNTQLLLDINARFNPEGAAAYGVEGIDEQITDLKPGVNERRRQAYRNAMEILQQRLAAEQDPLVRQDLEILIGAAQRNIRGVELEEKYNIPYFNLSLMIFGGMRALLDEQLPAQRHQAALTRLRRYTGMEAGYTPLTKLAEQLTREQLNKPGLIGPIKAKVEKDLANSEAFISGIEQLLEKYQIHGYQEAYAKLKEQIADYNSFVRNEVLPKARTDYRLPPELYAFRLEQVGVDISPDELTALAHQAFNEIQRQMQALVPEIAKQKGINASDYRDLIRALKRDQLVGDAILPFYQQRIKDMEAIIEREHLVTLPERPMRIRLASAAESAAMPAPNMRAPRLIGNTGEMGVFVLPLSIPAAAGGKSGEALKFDDFTFAAASWTLIAHEGRPGHELQFDSMVERGVSLARSIFAFNSVNVEGWGLYAEAISLPYMPPEGQLISLQLRLLRAARAFLDPELQAGKVTPEQARHILKDDVVLSEAFATEEVERFIYDMPGQATAYFYGYYRLSQLRNDVEKAMGSKFNAQQFHDFILSQGLLPPALMRKAVFDEFVKNPSGNAHKS